MHTPWSLINAWESFQAEPMSLHACQRNYQQSQLVGDRMSLQWYNHKLSLFHWRTVLLTWLQSSLCGSQRGEQTLVVMTLTLTWVIRGEESASEMFFRSGSPLGLSTIVLSALGVTCSFRCCLITRSWQNNWKLKEGATSLIVLQQQNVVFRYQFRFAACCSFQQLIKT